MSLIKTFLLEIESLGFNPYQLNSLTENEWDILITKALSKDKKLYETFLILKLEKVLN